MFKETTKCRICGNSELIPILNLGEQYLTGIFPKNKDNKITKGPLELVKCRDDEDGKFCGLLQLKQSYDLDEMYGLNYGYRSGLNQSMVTHLQKKVSNICTLVNLEEEDLIIDIGSNDSTLLRSYPKDKFMLAGIDPTGKKFKDFYPASIRLIPDFFSSKIVKDNFGNKKAKVVTSIAMFYDLESPMDFMRHIYDILADDGIWVFEQSYMPAMLDMNAYDTICHEHLEYYALKQIKWMTDRIGFKIIDVELNDVNGGSFSVIVAKESSGYSKSPAVDKIMTEENKKGFNSVEPFQDFKKRVYEHREEIIKFVKKVNQENKKIFGYGASTKGNVILQFCSITEKEVPFIAEVNKDKFGSFTPGTLIPIISEEEARAMKPDYFLVLPWHFKKNITAREAEYIKSGGKLYFPLPTPEITQK